MSACGEMNFSVRDLHAYLSGYARGVRNDHALACIIASWSFGGSALPVRLGLSSQAFNEMIAYHFPGADLAAPDSARTVDVQRVSEIDDLRRLMLGGRANVSPSEDWMATIVASACMGDDHLWQDLGLWSRSDLSCLMHDNFPLLATRNDRDMKWKKFLYKQLCETEGIYVCRSPSCEVCADYANCFGSED